MNSQEGIMGMITTEAFEDVELPTLVLERQEWTQSLPTEQGWYWWWNGDENSCPVAMSIFRDSAGRFFSTIGQLGLNHPIFVEDHGGWWLRLIEPETPNVSDL
jgi:hypothetical protein